MTRSCTYLDSRTTNLSCTECGRGLDLCSCANPDEQAHERLHSPEGLVMQLIQGQLTSSDPDGQHALASLTAEVGKLAACMINHDRSQEVPSQEVLRRAVMTAALAIRIAVDGDDNFLYQFPMIEEELPRGPAGDSYNARAHEEDRREYRDRR